MEVNKLNDKIAIINTKIEVEKDLVRKQELQKQLRKLQLQKEIEHIKKRIEQLG
jgi:hypothetical protein